MASSRDSEFNYWRSALVCESTLGPLCLLRFRNDSLIQQMHKGKELNGGPCGSSCRVEKVSSLTGAVTRLRSMSTFASLCWPHCCPARKVIPGPSHGPSAHPRSELICVDIAATPNFRSNLGRRGGALRAALCQFYIQRAE